VLKRTVSYLSFGTRPKRLGQKRFALCCKTNERNKTRLHGRTFRKHTESGFDAGRINRTKHKCTENEGLVIALFCMKIRGEVVKKCSQGTVSWSKFIIRWTWCYSGFLFINDRQRLMLCKKLSGHCGTKCKLTKNLNRRHNFSPIRKAENNHVFYSRQMIGWKTRALACSTTKDSIRSTSSQHYRVYKRMDAVQQQRFHNDAFLLCQQVGENRSLCHISGMQLLPTTKLHTRSKAD